MAPGPTELLMRKAEELFEVHRKLLWLSVRRRAKFDSWLKFELAYVLGGDVDVPLREGSRKRADVAFDYGATRCFVMVRVFATNWVVRGVARASAVMPATREVRRVLRDIADMKTVEEPNLGFVLLALSPVDPAWGWEEVARRLRLARGGEKLLAECSIYKVVEVAEGAGLALLLFGPYASSARPSSKHRNTGGES